MDPTTTAAASTDKPTTLEDARAALTALDKRHGRFYDALTDSFSEQVQEQVTHTVATMVDTLRQQLEFDEQGYLKHTPANLAIIQKLDTQFEQLMTKYGYDATVSAFVNQFPNQLPMLKDELEIISKFGYKGGPLKKGELEYSPVLAGPDLAALAAQQKIAKDSLVSITATVGDLAKRKAMLSIGGLGMPEMTDLLTKTLSRTTGECRTLGATSLAIFYRTANAKAVDKIEENANGQKTLWYFYDGPDDKLTRPFCHKLLAAKKVYTRAQIDQMNNGQLPDVFTTSGGYNCRHQFRLALPDEIPESERQKEREISEAAKQKVVSKQADSIAGQVQHDLSKRKLAQGITTDHVGEAIAAARLAAKQSLLSGTSKLDAYHSAKAAAKQSLADSLKAIRASLPKEPKPPKPPKIRQLGPIEQNAEYQDLLKKREVAQQELEFRKRRLKEEIDEAPESPWRQRAEQLYKDALADFKNADSRVNKFKAYHVTEDKFRKKLARTRTPLFQIADSIEAQGETEREHLDNLAVDVQMRFPAFAKSIEGRKIVNKLYVGQDYILKDFGQDYTRADGVATSSGKMYLRQHAQPRTPGQSLPTTWRTSDTLAETKREANLATFIHESGHLYHFRYSADIDADILRLYELALRRDKFITKYAETDRYEYFTEAFTVMFYRPDELKASDPDLYTYLKAFMVEKGILPS